MQASHLVAKLAGKSYEEVLSFRQGRDYDRLVANGRLKSQLTFRKESDMPRALTPIDAFLLVPDEPDLLDALKPD